MSCILSGFDFKPFGELFTTGVSFGRADLSLDHHYRKNGLPFLLQEVSNGGVVHEGPRLLGKVVARDCDAVLFQPVQVGGELGQGGVDGSSTDACGAAESGVIN